jgi:DNA replication protein DnaC
MKNQMIDEFIDNCRLLKLKNLPANYRSVVDAANKSNVGFLEFLASVMQQEADDLRERSIKYRLKSSRLPEPYNLLENFDFDFQPKLSKKLIMDLATMDFIRRKESVLFTGRNGRGKSHLARSLALEACKKGIKTYYTTCSQMLGDLNIGVYEKTLVKRIRKYINPQLLVIDEMGHDRLELEVTKEAHLLFKVIDGRYKLDKPLIFTTNVEQQDWAEYLGDPTTASAILDRVFHRSIRVHIEGPSYREYEGQILQESYKS